MRASVLFHMLQPSVLWLLMNSMYGKYGHGRFVARRSCGYCLGCGVNLPRGCPVCFGETVDENGVRDYGEEA
jgi:hypothetical protein